ncbi:MAG TPA: nuclear transport factor 2 family protein [Saprospiraceae bacterium]|nr:nuclear transport factor 2 family protein [Saprospiraceae bacterium]
MKDNTKINEDLVRTNFEYSNQHDWEKMASMYADSTTFKDPSFGNGMVVQTRAEIIKKYSELAQMIPDVKDEIKSIYHAGDHVIVEFISKGTEPDKEPFELPICTIFKIEKGKFTQDFTYYDNI